MPESFRKLVAVLLAAAGVYQLGTYWLTTGRIFLSPGALALAVVLGAAAYEGRNWPLDTRIPSFLCIFLSGAAATSLALSFNLFGLNDDMQLARAALDVGLGVMLLMSGWRLYNGPWTEPGSKRFGEGSGSLSP